MAEGGGLRAGVCIAVDTRLSVGVQGPTLPRDTIILVVCCGPPVQTHNKGRVGAPPPPPPDVTCSLLSPLEAPSSAPSTSLSAFARG